MNMETPSYEMYIDEKDNRDLSQIPGTFGYPVIGQTFDFLKDPLSLMLREYQRYGHDLAAAIRGSRSRQLC